jgi:hypothetical protein
MESRAAAKDLFSRMSDFITKSMFENNWRDAKGKILSLVNLSTDEKWAKNEPWKGIFYLRFFYQGKEDEKPTIAGIGSFGKNQIVLDGDMVTEEMMQLFVKFGFGAIAPIRPSMHFTEMKEKVLPQYKKMARSKKTGAAQ